MQPLPPQSRFHPWKDVTNAESKALIALELAMGIVHQPTLAEYFQSTFWLTETPGFSTLLTHRRYELIRSFLHFVNNDEHNNNEHNNDKSRLYKIQPILDIVESLYRSVYSSDKQLSIDEPMVKFKGRLVFKQYLPSKPYLSGV